MKRNLTARQKKIIQALQDLGDTGTAEQIVRRTGGTLSGIKQTLAYLTDYFEYVGGVGGKSSWRLLQRLPEVE